MKATRIIGTSLILIVIFSGVKLEGQDAPPANPYSGDLWKRSTLSGDWWGLRNDLAAKGVTIDMSLTQSAQGIVHGGKDTGWQYGGGRSDIFLCLLQLNKTPGCGGLDSGLNPRKGRKHVLNPSNRLSNQYED